MDKKIIVSDEFVDIYTNFNVSSQQEKMKSLSKKELYLLVLLCVDKHSDEDPVCINNYRECADILEAIQSLQDSSETDNQYLIELGEDSGDKTINVDVVEDSKGQKLPEPLKKDEVRNAKIHNVLDNSK